MSTVIPITRTADEAYLAFCEASRKAQATLDRRDCDAAGKAWRRYLDLYITPEQRAFLDRPIAKVVPCR